MATNLLWAHLLRKDAAAAATDTPVQIQIPPIAPHDKTATSMRILIHDTQANLEMFSTRLDGLMHRVEDCRAQVVNANKLLDAERDKVLSEILELAHRCQSEMKAHIGTPAQASALDLVHAAQVSTEKSVQALEKRIDALQTILQTHTHAMQSIQDQQNALMGSVLPLVPIVHGISPQMDRMKTALTDTVANAVSTMTNSIEGVRSMLVADLSQGYPRSSIRVGSSSTMAQRERADASTRGFQVDMPLSSPLESLYPREHLKRARLTHHVGDTQLPHKLSRLAAPLTSSSDPPPLLRTPQTPRQPLADLLFIPGSNTARRRHSPPRERMRSCKAVHQDHTPKSRRHFRPLCPDIRGPTIARRHSGASDGLPNVARPSDRDAISTEIKIEDILEAKFGGVISIHSSPLSSPPLSTPHETRSVPWAQEGHQGEPIEAAAPSSSNPEASPPKSMSLRDRRAQMSRFGRTETRRFIPLAPWSDEEE